MAVMNFYDLVRGIDVLGVVLCDLDLWAVYPIHFSVPIKHHSYGTPARSHHALPLHYLTHNKPEVLHCCKLEPM